MSGPECAASICCGRRPSTNQAAAESCSRPSLCRSMLGRGVKRKWSCLQGLEDESLPAAVAKERTDADHPSDRSGFLVGPPRCNMSHLQQRQLVLGLCLEKLQHYQTGVGLSLRRSVLLINTLRQIQEEMQSDGTGPCALVNGVQTDSCLLREDMPVTCPGCADVDGDSLVLSAGFSSQEASGLPDQPKTHPTGTVSAFSDAATTVGYLSDVALDDIFEDIDTSMYETSDLPSSWVAGSLWPISVSLWADEDVKICSTSHASAGSLQSCLVDLNELDQIMEILVNS